MSRNYRTFGTGSAGAVSSHVDQERLKVKQPIGFEPTEVEHAFPEPIMQEQERGMDFVLRRFLRAVFERVG